jgi:hypothetical protein
VRNTGGERPLSVPRHRPIKRVEFIAENGGGAGVRLRNVATGD